MISSDLRSLVRCPDCRSALNGAGDQLQCRGCGRAFDTSHQGYLDLRPRAVFSETTKYVDEALHADARHETVSPPLLTAGVRNHMLRSFLSPGPEDRVIDLGCGSGRMLVWNQSLGAYGVGVDVSPFFAREALTGIDLILGDLRSLPFPDETFTKAYTLDVLEHVTREALHGVLREAWRVLVPGGTLFVYSHVRKNSRLALGLRGINALARVLERAGLIDMTQERLRKSDHLNPLVDMADLRTVTAAEGFEVSRIRYYTPLLGGLAENIVMRMVEHAMTRRAARTLARRDAGSGTPTGADAEAVRAARATAKRRINRRGPLYGSLKALTWLMNLDVWLFGRVVSGPYFALLVKRPRPEPAAGGASISRALR